jgi:hypothetical protein
MSKGMAMEETLSISHVFFYLADMFQPWESF